MPHEDLGVVVGVSGSAASRVALHWAARTASARGLLVTAVLAVSAATTPVANRLMVLGVRELPHRRVERIITDTADIVATAAGRGEPPRLDIRVIAADPLQMLAGLSGAAALVVVGARCRSPWLAVRYSLGSKLTYCARCPVVIVRDDDPWMPHPGHAPARVRMTGWERPG